MVSLHDATILTKKGLIWFGAFLVIVTILTYIVAYIHGFFVKPPPPPTMCYGKLPSASFPDNGNEGSYSYTINTLSGTLPTFSDRIVIPQIAAPQPSLIALQNAQDSATKLGYTSNQIRLSGEEYEWVKSVPPEKTLKINIFNDDFSVISNFFTDQTVLSGQALPTSDQIVPEVMNFLGNITPLPADVDTSLTKITNYNIENGTLLPVNTIDDTKIFGVTLYQKAIDNCYVDTTNQQQSCSYYYPNYPYSTMNFYIAGGLEDDTSIQNGQMVQADYFHRDINPISCPDSNTDQPTYPLISTQTAFEQLQKGNAYIAQSNKSNTVAINDVSLGYYMGNDPKQQYLVPIYIFKGNDGAFVAYVLAVSQ